MPQKKYSIIVLGVAIVGVGLVSFGYNDWFSQTMPRHQLFQLPFFLILGLVLTRYFNPSISKSDAVKISGIIFVMGSLVFWMLPLSIDLAVIHPWFNRLMHLNLFIAGILLFLSLHRASLPIKMVFYGMLTAMLIGTGIILSNFSILLCSAFDIPQQQETGNYLIAIGAVFLILTYLTFFIRVGKK